MTKEPKDDESLREPEGITHAWATWVPCPACGPPERIPPRLCLACGGDGKVMALDAILWRDRLGLA